MTWVMVDVEADGPAPGLYSMVSFGAVVAEPLCTECGDTQRVWDNGDTTDCGCVNRALNGAPLKPDPKHSFYSGVIRPLLVPGAGVDTYVPAPFVRESLAISGVTRAEQLDGQQPAQVMHAFRAWLKEIDNPRFVSDNNGYDWQFINYYFHRFGKNDPRTDNPFGHSSQNLGSLYKGLVKSMFESFKHLRKTKHTHHPVDDARGNVEAMVHMRTMGLKIKW